MNYQIESQLKLAAIKAFHRNRRGAIKFSTVVVTKT